MYDKEIVLNLLENMIEATQKILHRNRDIKSIDGSRKWQTISSKLTSSYYLLLLVQYFNIYNNKNIFISKYKLGLMV